MSVHPRTAKDLALAPVAVEVDTNLQGLRDKSAADVRLVLELAYNRSMAEDDREQRAAEVLEAALQLVDLRGWRAELTEDLNRLRLSGGSVTIELGLGLDLTRYIEQGISGADG